MGKIHILSEQLQNQIAAGEVVERPASVVKELVENAIDAGATKIRVEVSKAGKEKIVVSDNGQGFDQADLEKAILRFATSKISSQEDLSQIMSYGFRGEALASISSVSKFSIQTRQAESTHGLKLEYDPRSDSQHIEPYACPYGTRVEVAQLFELTPVRLKFLKSDTTELHHILDTLEQIILIHPHLDWSFKSNERDIFHYPALTGEKESNLLEHISRVLSVSKKEQLAAVSSSAPILKISGFIGSPALAKHNKNRQYLFINGRAIKNSMVSSAVMEGYKSFLPHGKYPFFVLDLQITADLVDVNVHPRKLEVRFLNSQQVFLAVKTAVQKAIAQMDLVSQASLETPLTPLQPTFQNPPSIPNYSHSSNSFQSKHHSGGSNYQAYQNKQNTSEDIQQALSFSKEILGSPTPQFQTEVMRETQTATELSSDRIIGQMNNAYIVVEKEEGMLVLDQHAVHERIRYEILMKAAAGENKIGQRLLIPEEITLGHSERALLTEFYEFFEQLGFELEVLDDRQISIKSIPNILNNEDISISFKAMLSDLTELDTTHRTIDRIKERAILFLSCKKAIKFGDSLTHTELNYLYQEWQKCAVKETCPHGRTLSYFVPFKELNKLFDRC